MIITNCYCYHTNYVSFNSFLKYDNTVNKNINNDNTLIVNIVGDSKLLHCVIDKIIQTNTSIVMIKIIIGRHKFLDQHREYVRIISDLHMMNDNSKMCIKIFVCDENYHDIKNILSMMSRIDTLIIDIVDELDAKFLTDKFVDAKKISELRIKYSYEYHYCNLDKIINSDILNNDNIAHLKFSKIIFDDSGLEYISKVARDNLLLFYCSIKNIDDLNNDYKIMTKNLTMYYTKFINSPYFLNRLCLNFIKHIEICATYMPQRGKNNYNCSYLKLFCTESDLSNVTYIDVDALDSFDFLFIENQNFYNLVTIYVDFQYLINVLDVGDIMNCIACNPNLSELILRESSRSTDKFDFFLSHLLRITKYIPKNIKKLTIHVDYCYSMTDSEYWNLLCEILISLSCTEISNINLSNIRLSYDYDQIKKIMFVIITNYKITNISLQSPFGSTTNSRVCNINVDDIGMMDCISSNTNIIHFDLLDITDVNFIYTDVNDDNNKIIHKLSDIIDRNIEYYNNSRFIKQKPVLIKLYQYNLIKTPAVASHYN
jgi:hypothetical protein